MVWLVVVQCVLRQRHAVAESQHFGCACEWRRGLSVVVHEPSVQHAVLRSGLRDGCVVWLVVVQCVMRSWHADSESECVGCCVLRRCVLWRAVCGTVVQRAVLPCELLVECVVCVVCVQRVLWRRHSDADSDCCDGCCIWRHAVWRVDSNADMQHPTVRLDCVQLVRLLCTMWQRYSDPLCDVL